MNNKITWKETCVEIFRWFAIFGAGSAAFLMAFGKGILFPLLAICVVLAIVWLAKGVKFVIEVAGGTLLMTGTWGLLVVFKHGKEPVGSYELIADPWAPYLFTIYFVLGFIISWQIFRAKQ